MSRAHIGKIRCQKCRAANPLGQELCVECGTRLMLISSTAGIRFQAETNQSVHDEHLLERVSALETHLLRLASRLEQVLELMLRQSRSAYFDHTLVETLIEVLSETKQIDGAKFDRRWRERCERDDNKQGREHKLQRVRASVEKSHHGGTHTSEVTQLVLTGFDLIENGKTKEGIKKLELAAAVPPHVAALQRYLSEHFLRAGKVRLANDYARRGLGADSHDTGVMLLAGLTHADLGEAEAAQTLLERYIERGGNSFSAHYALGRIYYAEGDWQRSLAAFKRCSKIKPCAEAFYICGALHFARRQFRLAISYLKKSLDLDHEYIDAAHTLAHAYLKTGETKLAQQMFALAGVQVPVEVSASDVAHERLESNLKKSVRRTKSSNKTKAKEVTKTKIVRGKIISEETIEEKQTTDYVPTFIKMSQRGLNGSILTGGNARLASLIVADALEAVVER